MTTKRSPTYLMNMILNPDGMYAKHPSARALLAEYMTQMPNLGLTQEQARLFGFDRQVLQQTIAEAALDEETRRMGLGQAFRIRCCT